MNDISYQTTLAGIQSRQLGGFFDGWPNPPTPETLHRMLSQAYAIALAVNGRGEVVGFVNAISDGILTAYIPLLEVRADLKGQGIGSELLRLLLGQLDGLYMIDTACDDDLVPFYEHFGLSRANAMTLRNYAAQTGRVR